MLLCLRMIKKIQNEKKPWVVKIIIVGVVNLILLSVIALLVMTGSDSSKYDNPVWGAHDKHR